MATKVFVAFPGGRQECDIDDVKISGRQFSFTCELSGPRGDNPFTATVDAVLNDQRGRNQRFAAEAGERWHGYVEKEVAIHARGAVEHAGRWDPKNPWHTWRRGGHELVRCCPSAADP